jgi:hypothetical protein
MTKWAALSLRTVLLMALIISWFPGAQAGLNDGLVAYYPFNGDAQDASGNGNHGIVHGGIKYVEGMVEQAVKLNGTDTYIRIANPSQKFDTQYTISGWVYTEGRGGVLACKYTWEAPGGGRGFSLTSTTEGGSGNARAGSTFFAMALFNESWTPSKYPKYTMPIGVFEYITAVYDEGNIKIYINGIVKAEKTISHSGTLDNPYDMLIGTWWDSNGTNIVSDDSNRTFDGLIDDLRIYNRALSESEVQQLYLGCQPSIDIILNSNNRVTGDKVIINAHINGPGNSDSSCEQTKVVETVWVKLPDDSVIPLIEPFTGLTLLPGDDIDTKIFEYTFSGAEPIGAYQIGGRFLHPFSGDAISTDIEVLTFSQ